MANRQAVAFVYGGIAAILLLCLFDMPYGFYSFVRFAAGKTNVWGYFDGSHKRYYIQVY